MNQRRESPAAPQPARSRELLAIADVLRRHAGIRAFDHHAQQWECALLGPLEQFLASPGKQLRTQFMDACAAALTGGAVPTDLGVGLELLHVGSLIIDDIEDNSTHRRGRPALHTLIGVPLALNSGNWLYFAAFDVVRRAVGLAAQEEAATCLTQTMLRCHQGQALDLAYHLRSQPRATVPELVDTIASLKTGALFGLGASLVALALERPADIQPLRDFGVALGVALQRFDDLASLDGAVDPTKQYEDLRHGRLTWPWAILADTTTDASYEGWREAMQREPVEVFAKKLRLTTAAEATRRALADLALATGEIDQRYGDRAHALHRFATELRAHYGI